MRVYCDECDIDITVAGDDDLTQSCANCGKLLSASSQSQTQNLQTQFNSLDANSQDANPLDASSTDARSTDASSTDESALTQQGAPANFALDSDSPDESPQRIGKYRIIAHVATGGFGTVYKGYDGLLDQYVAIKVPRKEKLDAQAENEFVREARTMAKLEHPSIVTIKEAGRDEAGFVYLVMKWIEGSTLAQYSQKHSLTPQDASRIVSQISRAVNFAHEQGFVHRDLKPSNILINEDGEPFVTDFGLAVEYKNEKSEINDLTAGTIPYMAPEQLNSAEQTIDQQTDIWALGVLYYLLLTGKRPFTGKAKQMPEIILTRMPEPPRKLNASIPVPFELACLKCLQKEKSRRWNSALDFANAIDPSLLTSSFVKKAILISVSAVACLLLVVFVWNAMQPEPAHPESNAEVKKRSTRPVNEEMGRVEMVLGPATNKIEVTPERVHIEADGPTFVSLGSIKGEPSLSLNVSSNHWESFRFFIGCSNHSTLEFVYRESEMMHTQFMRKHVQFDSDLSNRLSAKKLGEKYIYPLVNGKSYKLEFYFTSENYLRTYRFGKAKNIGHDPASKVRTSIVNYGSDSVGHIKLNSRFIPVVGEFGVYLDKGDQLTLSNLKINDENIEFKE